MAQQINRAALRWLLGALCFALLIPLFSPTVKDAARIEQGDVRKPIQLPHSVYSENVPRHYTYTARVEYKSYQSPILSIAADDCLVALAVNGEEIPLAIPDAYRTCDSLQTLEVDLSGYLKEGDNDLIAIVRDREFSQGIEITASLWQGGFSILNVLAAGLVLCVTGFFAVLVRPGREPVATTLLFLLGAGLSLYFWAHTSYMHYAHDFLGHREYMLYLLDEHRLPPPHHGWMFYHPPLYYLVGAFCLGLERWLQCVDGFGLLRLFNFACYLTFLYYGIAFLRRTISSRPLYLLLTAMLVTYPVLVLSSTRMEPQTLLNPLWAAALYYLARWVEEKKENDLIRVIFLVALGILTRSNMLVMLATFGFTLCMEVALRRTRLKAVLKPRVIAASLYIFLALAGNFGDSLYYRWLGDQQPLLIGNSDSLYGTKLELPKEFVNYILFDPTYADPFYNPYSSVLGHRYFWPALLKTSLFGEFSFKPATLASLMQITVLIFWLLLLWAMLTLSKKEAIRRRFYTTSFTLCIAAIITNRVLHPFAPSQDFRYVMPMILLVFYGLGLALERLRAKPVLYYGMQSVMVAFALVSALYYPLHFWM